MRCALINLVVLSSVVAPAAARTVELTLYAVKTTEPAKKYNLLPRVDEQTDADAAPLYEKALQSLPNDLRSEEIHEWLKTSPDKLPHKEVQTVLEKLAPSIMLIKHATVCKQCEWPYLDDGALMENSAKYRRLFFFLALKMRFQIAQSRYDHAIDTVRTGFAMTKHLEGDVLPVRGLMGIAIAAYTCRQLEEFIQGPDAPGLYQALRDLPKPLVDLTEQIQWEDADIKERVHSLMNRLERHVAILECIEAMRLYAAAHEGQFPDKLSDVTLVSVPDDPVMHKSFVYSRTGSKAVLEGPAPKGASSKEAFRYELNLEP
jgi:hypothetical protein